MGGTVESMGEREEQEVTTRTHAPREVSKDGARRQAHIAPVEIRRCQARSIGTFSRQRKNSFSLWHVTIIIIEEVV